ncbi:hypothetical protein HMPREF1978_01927 [Actinomyces graevenitzii F0530]|uniref:Uncharacterized protein n=1 Tax=Actinomyces graevenitzii F0530 TaxID=1321817 RepID=U1R6L0_9ACTO|nr:hypothetical protein HMPREF1978_01927 [Actinomyces graevenitzii F0530]
MALSQKVWRRRRGPSWRRRHMSGDDTRSNQTKQKSIPAGHNMCSEVGGRVDTTVGACQNKIKRYSNGKM